MPLLTGGRVGANKGIGPWYVAGIFVQTLPQHPGPLVVPMTLPPSEHKDR